MFHRTGPREEPIYPYCKKDRNGYLITVTCWLLEILFCLIGDYTPRDRWTKEEVFPDRFGNIRQVMVRTATSQVYRDCRKIVSLEDQRCSPNNELLLLDQENPQNKKIEDGLSQFFKESGIEDFAQKTIGMIEKDGQTETQEGYLLFNQSNSKMLEPEPEPSLGLTQPVGIQHSTLASPTRSSSIASSCFSTLRDNRNWNRNQSKSGLRNFAKNVIEKVQQKGMTSFDKIADEMFKDMCKRAPKRDASSVNKECTRKNIRRRVYDVLNVMVAMEMISKDKSKITWLGLPPEITEEQQQLEKEIKDVEESIQQKTSELQHLIIQQIAYKNLLERRRSKPNQSYSLTNPTINLPFIAVKTSKNTVITHSTSSNEFEHVFNFDQPFEILDNMEVLIRMGMAFGLEKNMCTEENLEMSKAMVSKELEPYLVEMAEEGPLAQKEQKNTINSVVHS